MKQKLLQAKKSFSTGKLGEKLASRYLERKGYKIIAMNYYGHWGELDIVTKKDRKLVFFEVKTRSSGRFGSGIEAFDQQKKKKLLRTINQFLKSHSTGEIESNNWQLDLIEIELLQGKKGTIRHFQNVFEE